MTNQVISRESPVETRIYEEIRIENTNHCGYKCFFCPREAMSRSKGYMSLEDFDRVIDRVGIHEGQVDLHGFGEPLLDMELPEKIARIKKRWPKAHPRLISTLGLSLSNDFLRKLIESGLGTLEISFYGIDRSSYKAAHGVDKFELVKDNLLTITTLARELNAPLQVVVREFPKHDAVKQPGLVLSEREVLDRWLYDIGVQRIRQHVVHNYGGGRAYNAPADVGTCSVTWGFRKRVLQITWDLDVIPCCFDSNSTVKFGNLREKSLEAIFAGDTYLAFIQAHNDNQLSAYPVCEKCERCFKS